MFLFFVLLQLKMKTYQLVICLALLQVCRGQSGRRVGKLEEVFAWKQITYDINGIMVLEDRFAEDDLVGRKKRSADSIYFDEQNDDERTWNDGEILKLFTVIGTNLEL
ncbi:hypothetical protein B5X24_HaOG214652 [Helicoverpa armigera]|uniref:Uncharacterized protein n=1 Tax=Helicoverpa armigera TaxID=29058 RepID=A0A2W1B4T7_HELAM|nr:hypothetical protein B5X24_HaOG214652 [Helicoverpa armigera]